MILSLNPIKNLWRVLELGVYAKWSSIFYYLGVKVARRAGLSFIILTELKLYFSNLDYA